tara:strand:- start:1116 stop:1385 length:270 start_codon:yes stop_codon:yes gene_type:complete
MKQDELIVEINKVEDKTDLRILRNVINDRIKVIGSMVKYGLDRGDIVVIDSPRRELKEEGTIVKVNRTRAVVNINGKQWNVPFALINKP